MLVRNENTNGGTPPKKIDPVTASLVLGGLQNGMNAISVAHSNIQNRQMFNAQLQYNERMYHYNNWYNSPKHQMQMYKDAGLNPNLLYGADATSSAITSPNAPQQQAQQFDFDAGNISTLMQRKEMQDEEIKNMQETNNQLKLQNDMMKKQLGIFDEQWEMQKEKHKAEVNNLSKELEKMDAEIKEKFASIKKLDEETKIAILQQRRQEIDNYIAEQTKDFEIEIKKNNAKLSEQQVKNAKAQFNLICKQIEGQALDNACKSVDLERSKIGLQGDQLDLSVKKAEVFNEYGIRFDKNGKVEYTLDAYNPDYQKSKTHQAIDNGFEWVMKYANKVAPVVSSIMGNTSISSVKNIKNTVTHDYNHTEHKNTTINN